MVFMPRVYGIEQWNEANGLIKTTVRKGIDEDKSILKFTLFSVGKYTRVNKSSFNSWENTLGQNLSKERAGEKKIKYY